MKTPSETFLASVERELRKQPKGAQRSVGGEVYWPDVTLTLDVITRLDYKPRLKLLLELAGHLTLEELEQRPLVVDDLKRKIVNAKRYAKNHRRAGEVPTTACDGVLTVGSSICEHAKQREIITRNPFKGIPRLTRRRTRGGKSTGGHRPVQPNEVMHPRALAEFGVGMRGTPLQRWQRRAVPLLIGVGMRPQDICALRWFGCRDAAGPLAYISVWEAVKDIGGYLMMGQPKTGRRDLYQFDAVKDILDRVYFAAGAPPVGQLVFPNTRGGLLDWGNWRNGIWYPALHGAGIASAPEASAPGAFDPYWLRHVGASTMLHALRHDTRAGRYSDDEVARQFAHSVQTLHRVYADIPPDMHGIAGLTMDEIIRGEWRRVWGPMPGEPDYEEVLLTTPEASQLTGVSVNALGERIWRKHLPAERRGGRYLVSEWDLVWGGLLAPSRRLGWGDERGGSVAR